MSGLRGIAFLGVSVAAMLCAVAGCSSGSKSTQRATTWARFFLESGGTTAGTPLTLPRSAVNLTVNPKPVITEGDIVNVELVQVELGKCLMFQLTPSAARDFYRLSGSHQGRRIVLVVNEAALGARRLDGAITDGVIYIFVETPDEELPKLVDTLKKSSVAVQQEIRRKG